MKRGYVMVIRGGDEEISAGIAEGIMKAREQAEAMSGEQVEVVEAEIDRQRIQRALLRVAVHNTNTAEDYADMMTKARGDYGVEARPMGLFRWIGIQLRVYAMMVLAAAYVEEGCVEAPFTLGRR